MNEKEILKLAEECGAEADSVVVIFNKPELLTFANACCDYQRELDATVAENWSCDMTQECSVADAIRANKGE